MSELPRVLIDVDSKNLLIDGTAFPYPYAGVEPTIAESPDGTVYPGITVTIACSEVQVIKPSEVLNGENTPGHEA